jgi:hypothetical protein
MPDATVMEVSGWGNPTSDVNKRGLWHSFPERRMEDNDQICETWPMRTGCRELNAIHRNLSKRKSIGAPSGNLVILVTRITRHMLPTTSRIARPLC